MYEFSFPTKVIFGVGVAKNIGKQIHKFCPKLPSPLMIVTVKEKWNEEFIEKIKVNLIKTGCKKVDIFRGVKSDPTRECIREGIKFCKLSNSNGIIGVGGGSSMDTAKVIAKEAKVGFLLTIPTTAGTGGEISPWAVITNEKTKEKESLVAKSPDIALLDPHLTVSMPPKITFFTGVDAFSHALESYLSKSAFSLTDALSLKAIELIGENLLSAVRESNNLSIRGKMLEASLLAGMAMLYSGLGLIHAIAHPIGGLYHNCGFAHGFIIAHLIQSVSEFNKSANPGKYQKIKETIERIKEIIYRLFKELNIHKIEVKEEDIQLLAKRSVNNVNALTNPRDFTLADIEDIIRSSFNVV
ncbi:MAG: iron-containing alcohol dehydrogenase [Candidatus Aerophobetes bacterium]|nr:iron-containing alcohol dehydrogenase [Candidatus Aerophobetes bacterium]